MFAEKGKAQAGGLRRGGSIFNGPVNGSTSARNVSGRKQKSEMG